MARVRKMQSEVSSSLPPVPSDTGRQNSQEGTSSTPQAETVPSIPTRLKLTDYSQMSLWQALERMTEDDWSDKLLYLYRSDPWTVNKFTKKKMGAIHKGGYPPITQDEIARTFGGGRFKLYLKMGKTTVSDAFLELEGKPKLSTEEELATPSETEVSSKGADPNLTAVLELLRDTVEERRDQAVASGDKDAATALNKSIDLMSQASMKANEIVAQAGKGTSLADTVATLKTLLEVAAPKSNTLLDKLMPVLIERMLGQGAQAANPATQFKDMLTALKEMREIFPEPEASPIGQNWKEILANALPQVVKGLADIVKEQARRPVILYPAGPGRYTPQPPGQQPPPAFPPGPQGPTFISAPEAVAAAASPPPEPGNVEAPPAASPVELANAPLQPIDEIKRRLVRMYYGGEPGDVAATFVQYAAPEMYQWLERQSVETLLPLIQTDAVLGILAREEGLREWLTEMVDGIAEAKTESGEEKKEPEPQPVQ